MKKTYFLITIILFIFSVNLYATDTKYIIHENIKDFENGKFTNISIDRDGYLSLSPKQEQLMNLGDDYIWTMYKDDSGNVFAGTGTKGKIYKIDPNGKVEEYFKAPTMSVISIKTGKEGCLYCLTSPESQLLRINDDKTYDVIYSFKESYAWDFAFHNDKIFVVTGDAANLYELDLEGNANLLMNSTEDLHFLCFVIKNDDIYIGSEGKGILYKYNINTKNVKVVYDTYENSIYKLTLNSKNNPVFITSTRQRRIPGRDFNYTDTFKLHGSVISNKINTNKNTGVAQKGKISLKNSAYELLEDGTIKKIITLDNTYLNSIITMTDGTSFIGTGDLGMLYRLDRANNPSRYSKFEERQIISLLQYDNDTILIGTGNRGSIYKLSLNLSSDGEFISKVYDSSTTARWGKIQWDIENNEYGDIYLQTRTGNSLNPDSTWSEWSNDYSNNEGSSIKSPSARYIQYKIRIHSKSTSDSPKLRRITLPYLPENSSPQITNIKLTQQKTTKTSKNKNLSISPNTYKLSWSGSDKDGDELIYNVFAKNEKLGMWIQLSKNLKNNNIVFDTRKLPDGLYRFKIAANDSLSNPPLFSYETEEISKTFLIDNSPPFFTNISISFENNTYYIKGTVKDNMSNIIGIEYSLNANEWLQVSPIDLIFDSKSTDFKFEINTLYNEHLIKGKNMIIIQSLDSAGNITTGNITFEYVENN